MAGERVFYRNESEFNEALDNAADAIRGTRAVDIPLHLLWWGAVAFQVFLYVSDWGFDWEVRRTLLPGTDLVKPVWVVIAGMVALEMVSRRQAQPRILRRRLCLECGAPLLDVETDDDGDGTCPGCGRAFNLGEYRRPAENRGRGFRGYIDGDHFDKAMYAAAEHLKTTRSFGVEGSALGWAWVGLGVSYALKLLGFDLLEWVPGVEPAHLMVLVGLLAWTGVYAWRVSRLRRALVAERLCLGCGFCLLQAPVDPEGIGRCPECGEAFAAGQYERPVDASGGDAA